MKRWQALIMLLVAIAVLSMTAQGEEQPPPEVQPPTEMPTEAPHEKKAKGSEPANAKEGQASENAPEPPVIAAPESQPVRIGEAQSIGEIVVTATRTEQDVSEIPQSVSIVTQQEIERRQAQTPTAMLREEPGIWAVQVTAQGSPIIRGQIGNRVLYMWDGIRINNGALFGGPNGFFNQVPIGAVDRIEVIRGPGAVQYGSDAIGGVVNILSKKGIFTEKRELGGEAYARYGTVDNERTETADFWISDKNYAFKGGITKQDVDDYRGGGGEGKQEPTSFKTLGGYANMAYKPAENHTLRLSWIQNRRDDIETYVQSKLNPSGIPRLFSPTERRGIVKFDYFGEDLGPASKELKFYAYDQYYDALRDRRVESSTRFTNTQTQTHQDVAGTGIQNVSMLEAHKFTYGIDYRFEDLGTTLKQRARTLSTGAVTNTDPAGNTPDGNYDVFDAFAIGEFKAMDNLTLSAGARFERSHISSDPEILDVIPNAGYAIEDLDIDKHWNSITWSVGGIYNVSDEWDLAGNISTGFRAPTFSDLLSAGAPVFASKIASIPSPDLEPEKCITYEFGPRYHSKDLSISLTGYWTTLDDIIVSQVSGTVDIPGQGTFSATRKANAGFGYTRGIEFAFAYNPARDWTIFGNATYTHSQDESIDKPFRFTPPIFGTLGLRYEAPNKRWWAEVVEVFADRLREHSPDDERDAGFSTDPAFGSSNTTTNPPLRSDYEIPGWAITNVRVGVTAWREGQRSFDLTLDLYNLFDTRYREAYSQQQKVAPGFNAVIGGRLKF